MEPRWGSLSLAVVGPPTLVLAVAWANGWLVGPIPERVVTGTEDCVTTDLLVTGASLAAALGSDEEGAARVSAAALVGASRCARLGELPAGSEVDMMRLAERGLPWIVANEGADLANEQLVDVWRLAAEQEQVGGMLATFVWIGVEAQVESALHRRLDAVDDDHREDLAARLRVVAEVPVDLEQVGRYEQRDLWRRGLVDGLPAVSERVGGAAAMAEELRRGVRLTRAEARSLADEL
ncbi:MAG: hypothetical protein H6738_08580 [Alphaproteobacteria bacterium]|nr:hypothetical protein [Alphaproteobacteria bacterium]MCB9696816.1 hypothetical protein [Alphaproteobacteria bacterium]